MNEFTALFSFKVLSIADIVAPINYEDLNGKIDWMLSDLSEVQKTECLNLMKALSEIIEHLRTQRVKIVFYEVDAGNDVARVLVESFSSSVFKIPFSTGMKFYDSIRDLSDWELFYAFATYLIVLSYEAEVPISKQYSSYEVIFKPYISTNSETSYISIGNFTVSPIADSRLLLIKGLSFGND